ncbi:MAG TPA: phytanoyl-CoA dioxygenase family protein [Gaiellaceae bacterium]|nr:phytanoyl-CoA dioxygenase family protein [Gaiellaceae bacterium]
MHRTRTRFAARVNHVASALERRGIRATYALHDRLLSNRAARRRFSGSRPELDEVQGRILAGLSAEGYAVATAAEVLGDDLWSEIEAHGAAFRERTARAIAEGSEDVRVRPGKEFVVRELSYGVEVGPEHPWLRACLSRRLLDVANTYLGLWSKLEYVDLWYSVPQAAGAERVASQRWHRDFNDRKLVKAFLYLVDVDESMGPFEYVPGSAGDGPYASVWPWRPLGENYPSQEEFAERVPEASVRTFTAPRGTLILCDTSGFHRGGLSTTEPRVLATVTYSSPASLASLTERSFAYTGALDALDPVARFALS